MKIKNTVVIILQKKFNCDMCGLCCQSLNKSHLYDDLNDGTGTCIHYDKRSRCCRIYAKRPIKCNIQKAYEIYFKDKISYKDYLAANYVACRKLKEEDGYHEH